MSRIPNTARYLYGRITVDLETANKRYRYPRHGRFTLGFETRKVVATVRIKTWNKWMSIGDLFLLFLFIYGNKTFLSFNSAMIVQSLCNFLFLVTACHSEMTCRRQPVASLNKGNEWSFSGNYLFRAVTFFQLLISLSDSCVSVSGSVLFSLLGTLLFFQAFLSLWQWSFFHTMIFILDKYLSFKNDLSHAVIPVWHGSFLCQAILSGSDLSFVRAMISLSRNRLSWRQCFIFKLWTTVSLLCNALSFRHYSLYHFQDKLKEEFGKPSACPFCKISFNVSFW